MRLRKDFSAIFREKKPPNCALRFFTIKKDFKGALAELKKVPHTEKETDYLLMLTYLKLDKHDEAVKIYRKHFADMQFFDTLTESLFLAGDYRRVLDLLNSTDNEPKNLLLKAKVYTSMKRYDDAEPIYRTLIAKNYAIFDSVYGLLSGYAARNMKTEFLKTGEMSLTGLGRFERKDFLLIQAARLAIDLKEIDLATKMVNRFFGEFPDSQYVREGYLLRGRLFKNTGRLEQCIADADRLMAIGGSKEDALFLKADCTEAKDSAAAVKIYLQLTESERFRELANSKIAEVSRNPAEVLKSAEYFKDKDSELYYTGMDRYLSLLDGAELVKNEQTVKDMLVSKNVSVMPGAYFHQGRILEVKKQPEQAAAAYMKGYYLFPESKICETKFKKKRSIYIRSSEKLLRLRCWRRSSAGNREIPSFPLLKGEGRSGHLSENSRAGSRGRDCRVRLRLPRSDDLVTSNRTSCQFDVHARALQSKASLRTAQFHPWNCLCQAFFP
ncbi:MAG: CDC27 family protein [Geovibrio sp.]|nr:CDC27 family protein [Geovibrio sp.]